VEDVDGEERVRELATMFGGETEANREAALEALWNAKQRTSQLG
jgi:DNA repair ATPase RecN